MRIIQSSILAIVLVFLISSCTTSRPSQVEISVQISVDGTILQVVLPAGSTVQEAIETAGVNINPLDEVFPPVYTVLDDGLELVITRVEERFETQQEAIPYERQELPNESMPQGEYRLIQTGQNGIREVTIRRIYENSLEVSSYIVTETILAPSKPEIVMVGILNPFTTIYFQGKLVYLTSGNAWVMEESTANRRPLVTTGDLDGRVFSLSPDGKWLLFTRQSSRPAEQEINTLWVVKLDNEPPEPINLRVANIIHFADWQPGTQYVISYSTVEPRTTAPGWQSNNDLYFMSINPNTGIPETPKKILEPSGGVYGWWGISFSWSPDGEQLIYSRPDSIGLVDIDQKSLSPLISITPLNTHADWAWIPGVSWGSDGVSLYFVSHAPSGGLALAEESPFFDLSVYMFSTDTTITIVSQVGMFSYPVASPLINAGASFDYSISFLQSIFPSQSATSRYRLYTMDRDGSELQALFPEESRTGLEPQEIVWGPVDGLIAFIYNGNLWILDPSTNQAQQVTGDGLTGKLDWK